MLKGSEHVGAGGECRFCSFLAGAGGDQFDSVWLADGQYSALISVGALVPGWSLIAPTAHANNLSEAYRQDQFWQFAGAASDILRARYGRFVVFEHGARSADSLTGCGVGHAHLHMVPLTFSLEKEASLFAPDLEWQRCKATDVVSATRGAEYLFVADSFDGPEAEGLLVVLRQPTSQFFRRVIANRLGAGDLFDYKKFPMLDVAKASALELRLQAAEPAQT